jgi:demethylmenaquinone methyltransferase/2-methoxy-6-polyprenyl-1,4-benzoquinol methylase
VSPHPLLNDHYTSPDEKPAFVRSLFDAAAEHYDPVVGWGFFGQGNSYRKWALERHGLKPGMQLLDVACGTGLVASAAATVLGSAAPITCLDPSEGMLKIARRKLAATFVQAGAEAIPLPDNAFDFLTVGYALRHFDDLERVFAEFHRVLRPGGRLLILEATKPASRAGAFLFRLYFGRIYPFLTRMVTRSRDAERMMRYFWETMDACVRPHSILAALTAAGFAAPMHTSLLRLFSEFAATKPHHPAASASGWV